MTTSPRHLIPQRVIDRVLAHVDWRGPDECCPWLLSAGTRGYGQVCWREGKKAYSTTVHRVVWIATHGLIPLAMYVKHTCPNNLCCNPAHLRLAEDADDAKGRAPHTVKVRNT